MTATDLKPKTLKGIRRLATHFREREGLSFAAALNKAALWAGFTSYSAAVRAGGRKSD